MKQHSRYTLYSWGTFTSGAKDLHAMPNVGYSFVECRLWQWMTILLHYLAHRKCIFLLYYQSCYFLNRFAKRGVKWSSNQTKLTKKCSYTTMPRVDYALILCTFKSCNKIQLHTFLEDLSDRSEAALTFWALRASRPAAVSNVDHRGFFLSHKINSYILCSVLYITSWIPRGVWIIVNWSVMIFMLKLVLSFFSE